MYSSRIQPALLVFHVDGLEDLQELQLEELQLEETCRRLIVREEQLFSQDSPRGEDEDQLQRDLEALKLQILMVIQNTFTSFCSSPGEPQDLRSALASIQQQELQDRRWSGCPEDNRVPVWRPQKFLSDHNTLLSKMVSSRLLKAAEDEWSSAEALSSPLKRQVGPGVLTSLPVEPR